MNPSYGDRDPIAALATLPGESALALVRVSGGFSGAVKDDGQRAGASAGVLSVLDLLASVFSRPGKLKGSPGHSIVHGWILEPRSGKKIDEVLVSVYRAPKSYTGEDSADISCHGGIAAVKGIMAALKSAGFRDALPGEFSFRAFMNGKLDLTRCESVMELVGAKTGKGREQAVRRLSGALEKEIAGIKALLVQVLAGTEIYLDYSEDEFFGSPEDQGEQSGVLQDDESAGRLPDRALAEEAVRRLKTLAALWRQERIYAEGALAVLAGRPNAGKSSLFNYLLREDRSIVTDIPGTTRDWIEALISVEGIPLRLADTAGLRNLRRENAGGESREPGDEIERIGIERSLELLDRADLVLYVIDGTRGAAPEDAEFLFRQKKAAPKKPLIILWNKADLGTGLAAPEELPGEVLRVSAKTGEGIAELPRKIAGLLESPASLEAGMDATGPGTLRQKELIDSSLASLEEALGLASRHEPLDLVAPLFRSAVNSLGEITGEVSGADILEAMFSRFCVGK